MPYAEANSMYPRYFHRILNMLTCEAVYKSYVRLPAENSPTPHEVERNTKLYPFFKDCLGALDGTHIYASVPTAEKARYRNRKGFLSQNVLAVCDFDMKFVYVLSGWEGSAADSMILENARMNDFRIPHSKFYLGDAGFPLSDTVLVPYRGVRYHLREWGAAKIRYVLLSSIVLSLINL